MPGVALPSFLTPLPLSLSLPVTCQSCLNSCRSRSWRRFRPFTFSSLPVGWRQRRQAVLLGAGGEGGASERALKWIFDVYSTFSKFPLLRDLKVAEERREELDFIHCERDKKSTRFRVLQGTKLKYPPWRDLLMPSKLYFRIQAISPRK